MNVGAEVAQKLILAAKNRISSIPCSRWEVVSSSRYANGDLHLVQEYHERHDSSDLTTDVNYEEKKINYVHTEVSVGLQDSYPLYFEARKIQNPARNTDSNKQTLF